MNTSEFRRTRRQMLAGIGGGLAVAALAACGQLPAQPAAEAPAAKEPTPSAAQPAAKQERPVVVWGAKDWNPQRNPVMQAIAESAQEKNPNIELRLDATVPGGDLWKKVQTEFIAGVTSYDILYNQVNWVQVGAIQGIFTPLDDMIARDRFPTEDYLDTVSWMWKNQLYAIPFLAFGEIIGYNKRLFDNDGVAYPGLNWTYEEMTEKARALTKVQGNQTVQWGYAIETDSIIEALGDFILNNGGKVLNDARDQAVYGEDPAAIQAAQLYTDYKLNYKIVPVGDDMKALQEHAVGSNVVSTDKVAMAWQIPNNLGGMKDALGDALGITITPVGAAGEPRQIAFGSNAWSVLGRSQVIDEAWQITKAISDEEAQTIMFGITFPAHVKVGPAIAQKYPGQPWTELYDAWQKGGHDYFITPDAGEWWGVADTELQPMYEGRKTVPEAMKTSADAVNAVFSARPPEYS